MTVDVGIVGLGGFGKTVLESVQRLEEQSLVRLRAVCEPDRAQHAELIARLNARGVVAVPSLPELLQQPVKLLWMPVPVPLHRPFVEQALAADKWVLCEKPAAGSIQDVDAMIAARDRAHSQAAIAFQDISEPLTPLLKQRLMDGELGQIQAATVVCCWPRNSAYFARNNWAGKVRVGESWVLDSPCMNAMAHFINLPLFLLGEQMESVAGITAVEAELYRARAIESADTCCIRMHLQRGMALTVYMTHSCQDSFGPRTLIRGEKGELEITFNDATWRLADGTRQILTRQIDHAHPLRAVVGRWTGTDPKALYCSLESARAQVLAVNAAFDAIRIHSVPEQFVTTRAEDNATLPCIDGVIPLMKQCADKGRLLHEGGAGWTAPAGQIELCDYRRFTGRLLKH